MHEIKEHDWFKSAEELAAERLEKEKEMAEAQQE
jgi:hypothetical protein